MNRVGHGCGAKLFLTLIQGHVLLNFRERGREVTVRNIGGLPRTCPDRGSNPPPGGARMML